MSGSITLTIHLFGAFRPYSDGQPMVVEVLQGVCVAEVKDHLKAVLRKIQPSFDRDALVDESALADDAQILSENAVLECDAELAILPPVCGG